MMLLAIQAMLLIMLAFGAQSAASSSDDLGLKCIAPDTAQFDVVTATLNTYTGQAVGCFSPSQFVTQVWPSISTPVTATPGPTALAECPQDPEPWVAARLMSFGIDSSDWGSAHGVDWTNRSIATRCKTICSINLTASGNVAGAASFYYTMWNDQCLCIPTSNVSVSWPIPLAWGCCATTLAAAADGVNVSDVVYVLSAASSCYSSATSSKGSTSPPDCASPCVARAVGASPPQKAVTCCGLDVASTTAAAVSPYYYAFVLTPVVLGVTFGLWSKLSRARHSPNAGPRETSSAPPRPRSDPFFGDTVSPLGTILRPSEPDGTTITLGPLRNDDEAAALAAVVMLGVQRRSTKASVPSNPFSSMRKTSAPSCTSNDGGDTPLLAASSLAHPDSRCPLCLSAFPANGTVSVLACDHALHTDCLREYLQHQLRRYRDPSCPVCHQDVRTASSPTPAGPAQGFGGKGLLSLPQQRQ